MWTAITTILGLVMPLIKQVVPDTAKQAEIQAELQKQLINNQGLLVNAMKEVMVADASQDDKYTKRARPTLVYWALSFVTLICLATPFGYADAMVNTLLKIPGDLWTLMTVGVGAFGISRGVEKGITLFKK